MGRERCSPLLPKAHSVGDIQSTFPEALLPGLCTGVQVVHCTKGHLRGWELQSKLERGCTARGKEQIVLFVLRHHMGQQQPWP